MSNYLNHTTSSEDRELEGVFEALSTDYRDKITTVMDSLCERFEERITELQSEFDALQTQLDATE